MKLHNHSSMKTSTEKRRDQGLDKFTLQARQ